MVLQRSRLLFVGKSYDLDSIQNGLPAFFCVRLGHEFSLGLKTGTGVRHLDKTYEVKSVKNSV